MVIRLPSNYVSPQGISYPNYWAYSENGRVIIVDKKLSDLMGILEVAGFVDAECHKQSA